MLDSSSCKLLFPLNKFTIFYNVLSLFTVLDIHNLLGCGSLRGGDWRHWFYRKLVLTRRTGENRTKRLSFALLPGSEGEVFVFTFQKLVFSSPCWVCGSTNDSGRNERKSCERNASILPVRTDGSCCHDLLFASTQFLFRGVKSDRSGFNLD